LALRELALMGVDGPGGVRRTPRKPLLLKLTAATGLEADAMTDRITRPNGMELSNDSLVLKPTPSP
jgi:hypothetical protein